MIETRVVYLEPGKLTLETIELPELKPNQILIQTHKASELRSIENMREAYRTIERNIFDLDIIFEHSAKHNLEELPDVFALENQELQQQISLKTLIVP